MHKFGGLPDGEVAIDGIEETEAWQGQRGRGQIHGSLEKSEPEIEGKLHDDERHIFGEIAWQNETKACKQMVMLAAGVMTRRVTRDVAVDRLSEDLWVSSRTPERLLKRALTTSRHVAVEVGLASAGEERQSPWTYYREIIDTMTNPHLPTSTTVKDNQQRERNAFARHPNDGKVCC